MIVVPEGDAAGAERSFLKNLPRNLDNQGANTTFFA